MDSGLRLWGIMPAAAIVLSNDNPTLVKVAARLAKVVFGNRIQICDGVADEVQIQAVIDATPVGGFIYLSEGQFYIANTINITDAPRKMIGQGFGYGGGGTTLNLVGSNFSMFVIGTGAFAQGHGYLFRDMYLTGDVDTGNALIDIHGHVHDSQFENLLMLCIGRRGSCVRTAAADGANSHGLMFLNCWFEVAAYGVYINGLGENKFLGCNFDVCEVGLYNRASRHCAVIGCEFHSSTKEGLYNYAGDQLTVTGCHFFQNNTSDTADISDIHLRGSVQTGAITGNVFRREKQASAIRETLSYNQVIITGNAFYNYPTPFVFLAGTRIIAYSQHSDPYMDIQAVTAAYVGSWAGTGAEQVINPGDPGWAAQPDVKRNLTVTCTNNAAPSGDVVIAGVNAKGQTISETFTIVPGGTVVGDESFATITSITIPAGVAAADTVDVGIGSKLGLSNDIYAVAEVYKVTRTTGGAPGATAADYSVQGTDITVDATYDTVDMATGVGIVAGDCYAINYKHNLNIISN